MDYAEYIGYASEITHLERMLQAYSGDESDNKLIRRIGLEQRLKKARAKIGGVLILQSTRDL